LDTLIAAHALALNVTLVTNNLRHFTQVRGLRTENWFAS
jgi:tRNA(fMet)-specific endonuclease VapC